jgi:DNA-binding HxlR family transcriptional regulator
VEGYGQYCPVALGAEVFAQRWTPIILRNLMVGCTHFGQILDGAPGLGRSILSQRLRQLERDGVVERHGAGRRTSYHLTAAGSELADVCLALGAWAARWRDIQPEHHDPYLVLWMLARLVDRTELGRTRVVVRFELTDGSVPRTYWVVAGAPETEVCATDPGYVEDGVVVTDARWLVLWLTGRVDLGHAQRAGGMVVCGPPWLVRTLAGWGRLSPFADVIRAS